MMLLIFLLLTAAAELCCVYVSPLAGLAFHGVIILLLLIPAMRSPESFSLTWLAALVMLPLSRILSYTIPYFEVDPLYWLAMIGVPLWLGLVAYRILSVFNFELMGLRFHWHGFPLLLVNGVVVLPLAFIGYQLAPETTLIAQDAALNRFVLAAVLLVVFGALLEEVLYRGLLLTVIMEKFGRWIGIALSGSIYGVMFVGTGSLPYMLLMGGLGMWWGWSASYMRSVWVTVLAHSLFLILVYLVLPRFL